MECIKGCMLQVDLMIAEGKEAVEEAVEGIRLGGRTVHLLVRFCLGLCLCSCLCLCLCGGCGGDQTWRKDCSFVGESLV